MKLKNMWKRFWTLDVHNHEGFTLVELIIVIAILAILSTGAIAGYSAYVTSANKTADQALVAEIKTVLTLHAYANGIGEGGYVVLNSNGDAAEAEGTAIIAALEDAYGENWATALKVKYTEWTDDGLISLIAEYDQDAFNAIMGSTFVTVSTPDSLMGAVTSMTGLVSDVIANSDMSVAMGRLTALGMAEEAGILTDLELDPVENSEEFSTAVSNLLVNKMSNLVQTGDSDNNLTTILFMYSSALAYSEATGDDSVLNQINENLSSDEFTFDVLNNPDTDACMSVVLNGLVDENGDFTNQQFVDFGAENEANNVAALNTMMGAVEQISGGYTDKDSLTNPSLYASDAVSGQINNYMNSVKAMAGMDEATRNALKNLEDGTIVIFVTADGSVSAVPELG